MLRFFFVFFIVCLLGFLIANKGPGFSFSNENETWNSNGSFSNATGTKFALKPLLR